MKISGLELFSLLEIQINDSFNKKIKDVASILTDLGFEIESIEFESEKYKHFVIGNVVECVKHPESAKLSICKVNTGQEILQVLCGAPNVIAGINVVLATQGAVVPKNGFVIKKTKLAGYESQGMICSADEMCIGENDGSIIELSHEYTIGIPYAEYINKKDAILDVSITPNRGDAISYYGLARELSAKGFGQLPRLKYTQVTKGNFSVKIDEKLAKSVFFGTFNNTQSVPDISHILTKCDIQKTKFPIVNMLNYITEIYGQPMHLYDASKIEGLIQIRLSRNGEKLITISGEEIELQGGDIVVSDDKKILSLAGIIGDFRSAVSMETKEYILESCAFNRDFIFQTIRRYNIHTNASFRFERYVDAGSPEFFPQGIYAERFAEKINIRINKVFTKQNNEQLCKITFSGEDIAKILGFYTDDKEIINILDNLGFFCTKSNGIITVIVPSWRHADISQVYDISEEILRFVGINNCRKVYLYGMYTENLNLHTRIKSFLSQNCDEIISLPFISKKDFALFDNNENAVILKNPINIEEPCLRSSLMPSLLHNIAKSESNFHDGSSIFEISKVFYKNSDNLLEHQEICIINHGFTSIHNPISPKREYNIFDIKECVLSLLRNVFNINIDSLSYNKVSHNALHPHQAFDILLGKAVIARIAQVHPLVLTKYDIKNRVFFGNIIIHNIPVKTGKATIKSGYRPFVLPNIKREISILIKQEIQCDSILRLLHKIANKRFGANILEIFSNDEIKQSGRKSLLIGLKIYQDKGLSGNEIEQIVIEVINVLKVNINAELRG